MIILMLDIQMSPSSEPPPHLQDVQPTLEPNEAPPVRRLDGEFTTEDVPFAAGTHCEVWKGQWVKGGDVKKVRLRLIMSASLTGPFVGGFENTSNASVTGGGA